MPSENKVAFAIECSNPDATNASNAHHNTTSFAASDFVRAAIHSARQTSMLQRTARQNSCGPVAASFAAVTDATSLAPGPPLNVPPALTNAANAIEPAMLPTSDAAHTARSSRTRTLDAATPCSITITLPVNSSAPANTTSVSATPNTAPWTSLAIGDAASTSGPVTETSSTTATPTKAPASAEAAR